MGQSAFSAIDFLASDVLDQITDGILTYDRGLRIRYLNRSAEKYFGRSRDELLGKSFAEAFPTGVGTESETQIHRALESSEPIEFEMLSPVLQRWVSFRAYPSHDGVTFYFRDVTERHVMEDAMRASEARYRSVFENNLVGILLTTPAGDILAANPAACEIFGRSEAELVAVGRAGVST